MGELGERNSLVDQIFQQYDADLKGELTAVQAQSIHADMRIGGISFQQVEASIDYTCLGDTVEKSELFELLQEMDRRYFLVQDFRWEFSMLDREMKDTITEDQARWFLQAVHGDFFSKKRWEKFLARRSVPGSGVSFAEIEVELCNIPSAQSLKDEEDEEKKEAEEKLRKKRELEKAKEDERQRIKKKKKEEKQRQDEEDRLRKEEQDRLKREEEEERAKVLREREEEEAKRKQLMEDEERGRLEAEERARQEAEDEAKRKEEEERQKRDEETARMEQEELLEAQRLQKLAEQAAKEDEARRAKEAEEAKDHEKTLRNAEQNEKDAEEEMRKAEEELRSAKDGKAKKAAEEAAKKARNRAKESKNKKTRYNLKIAITKREKPPLEKAVGDFKQAKLPDDEGDLAKGEKMLKLFKSRDDLNGAMRRRNLKEIEGAVHNLKKSGFEVKLANELVDANKLMLQLRRLERIRAEILELKQSTVAEIRSYHKPPPVVHTVMTATFLLLGHKEKETKVWKTVQALVGKTGKDGLKRRCLELKPDTVDSSATARAAELLEQHGLDEVRDVSAGAATFFLWAGSIIEEAKAIKEQKKFEAEEKKKAAEAKKLEQEENKKRAEEAKKEKEQRKKDEEQKKREEEQKKEEKDKKKEDVDQEANIEEKTVSEKIEDAKPADSTDS